MNKFIMRTEQGRPDVLDIICRGKLFGELCGYFRVHADKDEDWYLGILDGEGYEVACLYPPFLDLSVLKLNGCTIGETKLRLKMRRHKGKIVMKKRGE